MFTAAFNILADLGSTDNDEQDGSTWQKSMVLTQPYCVTQEYVELQASVMALNLPQ
jgi:hypothetical protein